MVTHFLAVGNIIQQDKDPRGWDSMQYDKGLVRGNRGIEGQNNARIGGCLPKDYNVDILALANLSK